MLSPDQIKAREGKLTASQVAVLMNGDAQGIHDLWRLHIGDPDYEPEDLSGVWAVQLGMETEKLNVRWYERKWGPVSRQGEVVVGEPDWMAATLDGWDVQRGIVVEAKHVSGWEDVDVIVDRYAPQTHWQMLVTRTELVALSVIMGAREPIVEFVPLDPEYAAILMDRATRFMAFVKEMREPTGLDFSVKPPMPATKIYDMQGNNEWAFNASQWIDLRQSSQLFEEAKTKLKALVPKDAGLVTGHGIEIKRARNGALTIRRAK